MYLLFVAEFQESIRAYIPEVISLLSHSLLYFRCAGADILVKLSEQASANSGGPTVAL